MQALRPTYAAPLALLSLIAAAVGCPPAVTLPPSPPPAASAAAGAAPGPASSDASTGAAAPDANAERSTIPDRYKWKLGPLFGSDAAFEKALAQAASARDELASYHGKLAQPTALAACLKKYFAARLLTNKVKLYAALRFDGDQKSSKLKSMNDRGVDAVGALMGAAAFIRGEVMALSDAQMARAYRQQPALADYQHYLNELRRRRSRVLVPQAERVLALMGDNLWAEIDLNELPADVEKVAAALRSDLVLPKVADEQGKQVQLNMANYGKLRASADRRVRRDTVEGFFGALRAYQNAFAAALAGQMRLNVNLARARGYPTAIEAYLDKDDIDPKVYHTMLDAVHNHLAPLHRYMSLRKKLMGLDALHLYDLYAPMVHGTAMHVPYDRARRIVPKALAPLGKDYLTVLAKALDPKEGWIDVYPNKNKDSGAFSVSVYGVHPFIKLNYLDEGDDVSVLAHELGHSVHSHLSMTHQPYVTANYATFIAEIASTLNQKLLSDYLLGQAKTDAERLYILSDLVETIRTTIYRQALFAEFELAAHTAVEQGKVLTAELLDDTYLGLIKRYYGPDFTIGDNDAVEWAYIPHFYYKYYLFTYATGLSAGIALAERIQNGVPGARRAYLHMLESGSQRPPLTLLREAGVDLTKPDAIEAAARLLDRTLTQLEAVATKVGAGAPATSG